MSEDQPDDRTRSAFEATLGVENGATYFVLYSDVVWLHAKWGEYRKLFGVSEHRVDILNSAAGFFFNVIQHSLWDDILLTSARLLDPIKQGKADNLTLGRLPLICADKRLATTLIAEIEAVRQSGEFIRHPRNKLIAHRDLPAAIYGLADSIPKGSRTEVDAVITGIGNAMNLFHQAHFNSTVMFGRFGPMGDGNALVHELAWAAMQRQHQSERFAKQTPLSTDFDEPRLD